jgi:hypothetical protein
MASEKQLQQLCTERIRSYLDANGYGEIQTGERTRIIKDCTFVPDETGDDFTLFLGHAEADVVLYKTANELTEEIEESEHLKLYQNASNELRIPYAVLEIKNGSLTTDAIRSRTIIAREMNEIFPFVGYFFVGDETSPTSRMMYRAGKHFDSFFITDEVADKEWVRDQVIDDGIEPHLQKLESLGVL